MTMENAIYPEAMEDERLAASTRHRTILPRIARKLRVSVPEEMYILAAEPETHCFAVDLVVLTGFDLYDLASLADIFDHCNDILGRSLFATRTIGLSDGPVISSAGLPITPKFTIADAPPARNIVLLSGPGATSATTANLRRWLRRSLFSDTRYIAIGNGCLPLLDSGLVVRPCIAVSGELRGVLREMHSDVSFVDRPFHKERQLISCYGSEGTTLLALHCAARLCGETVAVAIADRINFGYGGMRFSGQPGFTQDNLRNLPPLLRDTIHLMSANVEEPLNTREIERRVGYSFREIQRQFRKYCRATPVRYYKRLRLHRAQRLLQQTGLSVTEISLAVGFKSPSNFAKLYAARFGHCPTSERCRNQP